MDEEDGDLSAIAPPRNLSDSNRLAVFDHFSRQLAIHRNTAVLYAQAEYRLSNSPDAQKAEFTEAFTSEINKWAQELLRNAWTACQEPREGHYPTLDALSDTSMRGLPPLPAQEDVVHILNTILFLHVTTSHMYHAHTRTVLHSFAPVDEAAVAATLKNPERAVEEAERKTQIAKEEQARQSQTMRRVGMGLGAVAGGVLVGVTGGLAAPLVGAGLASVLGWLGVGGTAAGLLASGLASSSVVCGALFGAYGSKKTADMVKRYTREVQDLAIVPVRPPRGTLAVRLCVSGWIDSPEDVYEPWTVFGRDDTFALQWEVVALMQLSKALKRLIKSHAMLYVKAQIIKRTVLASLLSALSPVAWLKIGQIIDNPWMIAKSLAVKAGKVLGTLIAQRVLGNRPITLVGYSLGSVVLFEALQHLATLPPAQTLGLVQDVYLFGAPIATDERAWAAARRVTAGRLINGYGKNDYVLAVLSRLSDASWSIAGLTQVEVRGVENVQCEGVEGHLKWRGMIGKCLRECGAPGLMHDEVELQANRRAKQPDEDMDLEISEQEAEKIIQAGPTEDQPHSS